MASLPSCLTSTKDNHLSSPEMVVMRSLVRIGGRRIVLSRAVTTQRSSIPWVTPSARTVDVRAPWSLRRGLATTSAVTRLEEKTAGLPTRLGSSSTAITQTDGHQHVLAKLAGIRDVLVDEVGGSEEWVERVDSAIEDLQGDRLPTLGGE